MKNPFKVMITKPLDKLPSGTEKKATKTHMISGTLEQSVGVKNIA